MAEQERRRIPRKYLVIYSRVFDRTTGQVLGYLSDLTNGGAMIISDDPMQIDLDISLRFDLPDPPLFSTDHLRTGVSAKSLFSGVPSTCPPASSTRKSVILRPPKL